VPNRGRMIDLLLWLFTVVVQLMVRVLAVGSAPSVFVGGLWLAAWLRDVFAVCNNPRTQASYGSIVKHHLEIIYSENRKRADGLSVDAFMGASSTGPHRGEGCGDPSWGVGSSVAASATEVTVARRPRAVGLPTASVALFSNEGAVIRRPGNGQGDPRRPLPQNSDQAYNVVQATHAHPLC